MDLKAFTDRRWPAVLILILVGSMLAACGDKDEAVALPEGCDGVTWGSAVEVEEREDEFYAIVQGDYPDSCSMVCGSEQEVEGDRININVYSDRPEDLMCSSMLTPFEEEILVDTEDLDSGEYTLTINETHATTTFILP